MLPALALALFLGPFTNELLVGEALEPFRDQIVIAKASRLNSGEYYRFLLVIFLLQERCICVH
jgi:hypothetical protein